MKLQKLYRYVRQAADEYNLIENGDKIAELEGKLEHYKQIEGTLNNTLIMAQSTAEDIKNVAKQQADQIIKDAESDAKQSLTNLEQQILIKQKWNHF